MAAKANIIIDQGTDYSTDIFITTDDGDVIPLTSYTGVAQIRKHYTSSNAVSFDVAISAVLGKITLSLSDTTTANLSPGRYVYDVKLTDSVSNTVSRIVEGLVTINPAVTR